MGIKYATDYAARFGFPREDMPQNLTLALGTLQVTPLELASAYATFANGGFRIQPYFIDHIVGPDGTIAWQAEPRIASAECEPAPPPPGPQPVPRPLLAGGSAPPAAGSPSTQAGPPPPPTAAGSVTAPAAGSAGPPAIASAGPPATASGGPPAAATDGLGLPQTGSAAERLAAADAIRGGPCDLPASRLAPRVISPQNDWLMTDIMADVIKHGTGQRALVLHRSDIAGKTGTTNESRDAWFNGFTPNLVTTVWVGYDQERSLGESEEGARTALPIWIDFMRTALKGVPEQHRPMPDGLVTLRISPDTGMLASAENPDAILETFMVNHLPTAASASDASHPLQNETSQGSDSLF